MLEYKSKRTAQTAFNREKKKLEALECPVFKEPCLSNRCAAFAGRIYLLNRYNKPTVWKVFKPSCTSPLVTGTIEMEMP